MLVRVRTIPGLQGFVLTVTSTSLDDFVRFISQKFSLQRLSRLFYPMLIEITKIFYSVLPKAMNFTLELQQILETKSIEIGFLLTGSYLTRIWLQGGGGNLIPNLGKLRKKYYKILFIPPNLKYFIAK